MFVNVSPATQPRSDRELALRDGYEVHRAALRYGLDTLLYPRQVLVARAPGHELTFVHGIPQTSSLSGVTYAQDKDARRHLLERAGLPIPAGATFAIGRDRELARAFTRTVGFPVVVKPAIGENMRETFAGINGEREFERAIDYFLTPEEARPAFNRSAYGLTLLSEPVEEDGQIVSPASYRFLVERHVRGEYVRIVVLGDRVVSALSSPSGSDGLVSGHGKDVTSEVHQSILDLAIKGAHAVPGLAVAALDLVVGDYRCPAGDQDTWIVDLSERPWLAAHSSISEGLSQSIGDAILRHAASEAGLALDEPRQDVALDFRIEGASSMDRVTSALETTMRDLALDGRIEASDWIEGTASGTVEGSAEGIAWLFEYLLAGQLDGERAMLIEALQRRKEGAA